MQQSLARLFNSMSATVIRTHNQYSAPAALPATAGELPSNPMTLFQDWFRNVLDPNSGVREPEAVALSTVSTSTPIPTPSTRFVLVKTVDDRGLVWFTNYESRKAKEIEANPVASIVFYWKEVSLSVRFVGSVERVTPEESKEYYLSRPLGSRIGAWASPQSSVIDSRDVLAERVQSYEDRFQVARGTAERQPGPEDEGKVQELPPHWGGYRLVPFEVEFWAGRTNRLHDRYRYLKQDDGTFKIERLAP